MGHACISSIFSTMPFDVFQVAGYWNAEIRKLIRGKICLHNVKKKTAAAPSS